MVYTLDNCEMQKLLLEKDSFNKQEYASILRMIEKPTAELLEFIKTNLKKCKEGVFDVCAYE